MSGDPLAAFRELALQAFQAPAVEFSDEDLYWEPALRTARFWPEIEPCC